MEPAEELTAREKLLHDDLEKEHYSIQGQIGQLDDRSDEVCAQMRSQVAPAVEAVLGVLTPGRWARAGVTTGRSRRPRTEG